MQLIQLLLDVCFRMQVIILVILIRTLLITTDTWNDQLRDRYRQRLRYVTNLIRRQKKDFESQSERLKFKFAAWNEKFDSPPSGWDHRQDPKLGAPCASCHSLQSIGLSEEMERYEFPQIRKGLICRLGRSLE